MIRSGNISALALLGVAREVVYPLGDASRLNEMQRSQHHWVFTVAAVFLLLFTAGDLAYPAMCGEDGGVTFTASQTVASVDAATSPDPLPTHLDDCFCCCGHVIAGVVFHIASPSFVEQSRFDLTALSVATAPPAAFRPPRVA
jgi:hypothetical protein